MVLEAGRDPLIPLITTAPAFGTEVQAVAFIEGQHSRLLTGEGSSWAIENWESGQAVGQIGLWFRSRDQGRASVGDWIVASQRGRGWAAGALRAVSAFGLSLPDIHRLEL
ncbi:GNAT family N-acetyltransferase [Deinococcus sp.]|uniref:GNAT family N-acetyltransferase n=1 Tax=Deinococcus sp. TaxID=47478 RepID=UPI0028698E51|nr:GNAT family N-acetyltransferase [Deinococcus sp.]